MYTAGRHSGGSVVAKAEGGGMQEVSRTRSVLALGCRHTPILSSPQRRKTKAQRQSFDLWLLLLLGQHCFGHGDIGVPACPQAPGRTSTRGRRSPGSGLWWG